MRRFLNFIIIIAIMILLNVPALLSVEYPVLSLGINAGYGQNELTKGFMGRAFLRYSLEAYIPGFQIEIGYAGGYYNVLADSIIMNPDPVTERRKIQTRIYNSSPMLSGTLHLKPFGESATLYIGAGAQFQFISAERKTTDRYWDNMAEKYQETEIGKAALLNKTKVGYHFLGGIRFALGEFGTVDFEVRQTFLDVAPDDWDELEAGKSWGDKSWNDLSVSVGMTVYIF